MCSLDKHVLFQVMWNQMQQKIVVLSQENTDLKQRVQMLEAELGRTLRQQAGMTAAAVPAGGGQMVSKGSKSRTSFALHLLTLRVFPQLHTLKISSRYLAL